MKPELKLFDLSTIGKSIKDNAALVKDKSTGERTMNKDEYKILSGVHKVLVGLAEIVESFPDTNETSELWSDITEARSTAKRIIER
jgi:hypothetical protein